jgi:hypothetical protein
MFKKTIKKAAAAIMALALAISAIPSFGGIEAQAATKTKVMETEVSFIKDAAKGTQSNVYLNELMATETTFGETYSLKMDIYVPAALMKKARLWISPSLNLYGINDINVGIVQASADYYYDINSDSVTKVGDFYKVQAEVALDTCYSKKGKIIAFPEGEGVASVSLFVASFGAAYKGSIYFDNVSLAIDGQEVYSEDFERYENGSVIGTCRYSLNEEKECSRGPRVLTFKGKALTVSKTSLSVKKGKTATIKAATMPSAKVTYTSSNKKIATVNSKGVVKGIKKGKATITVKANGKTVKVKVTVK